MHRREEKRTEPKQNEMKRMKQSASSIYKIVNNRIAIEIFIVSTIYTPLNHMQSSTYLCSFQVPIRPFLSAPTIAGNFLCLP